MSSKEAQDAFEIFCALQQYTRESETSPNSNSKGTTPSKASNSKGTTPSKASNSEGTITLGYCPQLTAARIKFWRVLDQLIFELHWEKCPELTGRCTNINNSDNNNINSNDNNNTELMIALWQLINSNTD